MMDELPELDMPQPLRTARLELRPFTREELEAVADGRVLPHFGPGFPSAGDRDWARGAIEAGAHFATESPYSRFVGVELTSGKIVGTGGFTGPVMNGELELEGSVVADRRNRGLASEALAAFVERAFEDPAVRAVHVSVPAETAEAEPARRMLLRLGFAQRPSDGPEDSYHLPRP